MWNFLEKVIEDQGDINIKLFDKFLLIIKLWYICCGLHLRSLIKPPSQFQNVTHLQKLCYLLDWTTPWKFLIFIIQFFIISDASFMLYSVVHICFSQKWPVFAAKCHTRQKIIHNSTQSKLMIFSWNKKFFKAYDLLFLSSKNKLNFILGMDFAFAGLAFAQIGRVLKEQFVKVLAIFFQKENFVM